MNAEHVTILLSWIGGSAAASWVALQVVDRVLIPVTKRTRTKLDTAILQAVRKPAAWTVLALGFSIGVAHAASGVGAAATHAVWRALGGTAYVFLVLCITAVVYAIVGAAVDWYGKEVASRTESKADDQIVGFFQKTAKFVFFFIALTIIFGHFGIQVTGMLATAGVVSLAVAFAAQETVANMISGIVLLVDRPFGEGDRVELVNGRMGDVLSVGLRSTRILSFDHTVITIPNAEIAKTQIVNFNAPNPTYKIRSTIGVAYGTDVRNVKRILMDVLLEHKEILREPAPGVFFTEFGESSLNLLYVAWVADYREQFRIRDELNMVIKDRFEAQGIEIPFPQRVVHLPTVAGVVPAAVAANGAAKAGDAPARSSSGEGLDSADADAGEAQV